MTYGNTSSGKSLLYEQSIGEWQKMGLTCAYADAEGTYEKGFGERLGINNDELLLFQKKSFGAMTDEIIPHIEAGIDILVIDSISDLLPEVFVDEKGHVNSFVDMKQIAAHAKSCTVMLNAIHYANVKTAVIVISQTTTKMEQTYVKQVPHGGKKIEFAVSTMVKLTSSGTEKQQIMAERQLGDMLVQRPVGRKVEYYVEKNKLGPQSLKGTYDMYYDGPNIGIDTVGEIADLGEAYGMVRKSGAWYYYKDEKFQGRANFVKWLKNEDEPRELYKKELHTVMTGEIDEV